MKRLLLFLLLASIAKGGDIAAPFSFADGTTYHAADFNNFMSGAVIQPAFISSKPTASPVSADEFIFYQAGTTALKQVSFTTLGSLIQSNSLTENPTFTVLTDGATITGTCVSTQPSQNWTVTLGGNRTLAISSAASGMQGILIVKQDGTGSRTLTLPAGSKVVGGGGGVITLSTAANSIDVLTWMYDGTNYYWILNKNFS